MAAPGPRDPAGRPRRRAPRRQAARARGDARSGTQPFVHAPLPLGSLRQPDLPAGQLRGQPGGAQAHPADRRQRHPRQPDAGDPARLPADHRRDGAALAVHLSARPAGSPRVARGRLRPAQRAVRSHPEPVLQLSRPLPDRTAPHARHQRRRHGAHLHQHGRDPGHQHVRAAGRQLLPAVRDQLAPGPARDPDHGGGIRDLHLHVQGGPAAVPRRAGEDRRAQYPSGGEYRRRAHGEGVHRRPARASAGSRSRAASCTTSRYTWDACSRLPFPWCSRWPTSGR